MIERQFVAQKIKEFQIQEYVRNNLKRVGHSHTKLQKTPLGEKIIIFTSRPGLVVGRKGENIKKLTFALKKKFNLENPQIEIAEVDSPNLDAQIVSEKIADSLEKLGSQRFKGISHSAMEETMRGGSLGIEILISGKVPSSRAKTWRFDTGYLKKSGDIAQIGVRKAYSDAQLKTGTIGVQVRIMPPDIKLPDDIEILTEAQIVVQEVKHVAPGEMKEATEKEQIVATIGKGSDEKKSAAKPKKKSVKKAEHKPETGTKTENDASNASKG